MGGTCKFVYFSGDCEAAGAIPITILTSAIRADLGPTVATRDSLGQIDLAYLGPPTRGQASSERLVPRKSTILNGLPASFLVLRAAGARESRYGSTINLPFMRSWPNPQNFAQTKS
jgi:hypothetical protein